MTENLGQKRTATTYLTQPCMGSYDGAEICELVGLFISNKLGQKFGKENIGLYRDDEFGNHEKQISKFGR